MKSQLKKKAIELRISGRSLREVSDELGISKSTASVWLRDIEISREGQERIRLQAVQALQKSQETKKRKRRDLNALLKKIVQEDLSRVLENNVARFVCSLLYWCEGEKHQNRVQFSNSDPKMIRIFLKTLREGFTIEESRFRVCVHVHEYHVIERQIKFWSNLTEIPVTQFLKPYMKPHTGKRKRSNYQGCVSIRYHDYRLALHLKEYWTIFAQTYGRVG